MSEALEYLFEKVFFQAAHIALLEEALETAKNDILATGLKHKIDVSHILTKIDIAYLSISKLKQGKVNGTE